MDILFYFLFVVNPLLSDLSLAENQKLFYFLAKCGRFVRLGSLELLIKWSQSNLVSF